MQKNKGITFTNKDGNIINDNNDTEDDIPNNIEITVVDENRNKDESRNKDTQEQDITGVPTRHHKSANRKCHRSMTQSQ